MMFSKCRIALAATLLATVAAVPAKAAWVEASSPHFVVYSDEDPNSVRAFAENLEKFDRALRTARKMSDPVRSPNTRLVIYRVKDIGMVRKLAGMGSSSGVAGYYHPDVSGPFAVVPRGTGSQSDYGFNEDVILFHEYAHHLQLADMKQPMPRWLSEGFAEFFSTARFMKNGSVRLGEAAKHRYMTMGYGQFLPIETMMADKVEGEQNFTLYAYGWALTHYLTFAPERRGQIAAFLADLERGGDPLASAKKEFGNLTQLDSDANAHIHRKQLPVLDIQPHVFKDLKVTVRTMAPAEAAIMPWRIESKTGVDEKEAPKVAAGARAVAARFPNDPLVLSTLAETEIDAKNYAASEAAATRLLAIQPRNVEGLIFKGRAMMERGKTDKANKAALFKAARSSFIAANKIDQEDPEPLAYFYQSYKDEGIAPSANAKAAIHYAADLMPQDEDVRMESVLQYARDNQLAEARAALIPIAYSPHLGKMAEMGKEMMAKLAAGDGKGAIALAEKAKAEAEKKAKKG